MHIYRSHVLICGGTGCTSSKSVEIKENIESHLQRLGLNEEVQVIMTGCFGLCEAGPILIVYPEGTFYSHVKVEDAKRIVEEHLLKGRIVKDLLFYESIDNNNNIKSVDEVDFYAKQKRIALANCGVIDPENIDEYIAKDGYLALSKVLTQMTPVEVIEEVKKSGLRGRGGAGFPTGIKWQITAGYNADQKYVCCNADEGDPGAFMDRSILEGTPHSIIEAMAIGGYAVGASLGYIYVRAEYPIAVKRLQIAIKQAREYGLLGKNILDTNFNFDIEIRLGAGAFVCGEETALIESIEGKRGMPRNKPPFPAEKGIWEKPTLLNNVETYANIPTIILKGGDWYASIGTGDSKGTKVFALGGKIKNTGLVEVPMGTTLREVIFDIGGGCPNGKKFKAAQTGGPSGGCLTTEHLDTPISFDNLVKLGSMMGSGGMIIMDEDTCMVDIARFYLDFTCDESCGKCTPCREGTKRLKEIMDKICEGKGTLEDLDCLKKLALYIKDNSLCQLGQSAPNPVLSTLNHFYNEYLAHIVDKKCPAGVCKNLLSYYITDKCIGCGMCAKACPADAISSTGDIISEKTGKRRSVINTDNCLKCGACMAVCPPKVSAIVIH